MCRVARDAPAADPASTDFISQAQATVTQFFSMFDVTKLEEPARQFVGNMQNVTTTLGALARENSGPIQDKIQKVQASIEEVVNSLKSKIEDPEFAKKTTEYQVSSLFARLANVFITNMSFFSLIQQTLTASFKNVLDDTEKFRAEIASQGGELGDKFSGVVSGIVDQVKKSIEANKV